MPYSVITMEVFNCKRLALFWTLFICAYGYTAISVLDLEDGTEAEICNALETNGNAEEDPAKAIHRRMLATPNVCAVEEVMGSRKRYYSECMTYMPRKICEKPTFIRYHCCSGFERTNDGAEGCQGVAPMENLMDTAKHLYLRDFRKHAKKSGAAEQLSSEEDAAYTLFAPHNKAFANNSISKKVSKRMSAKVPDSLLLYHVVNGRHYSQDLLNEMELPSLYNNNETIKFNRYSNGILTANCARVILPNQIATNGVLHVTEKVVEPINGKSVMDIMLEDDRFGEMVTALIVSGLDLRGTGPYTVFAITDEAFTNAPEEVIERILNNEDLLKKFLNFHLLDRSVCSAAIIGPTKVPTLEGEKVELSCDGLDRMTVNGIPVRQADMVGTNGVVHVINELMVPDSVKSLKDVIQEHDLYEFLEYAQQAGLSEVLEWKKETNMTFLVPSADAFSKLTDQQRRILQTQPEAVARVFKYHAIPGKIKTKDMVADKSLRTDSDDVSASISISVYHNKVFGASGAKFESTDHEAGNGVVHIIDRVLFPPEGTAMAALQGEASLSTFVQMLELSGLSAKLSLTGEHYTIFAPNDDAFEAMDTALVESLLSSENDEAYLKTFLEYHILRKPIYTSGVKTVLRYRFKTEAREWINLKRESEDVPIKINEESSVIMEDLVSNNGVVHVIDTPLWCPCMDQVANVI